MIKEDDELYREVIAPFLVDKQDPDQDDPTETFLCGARLGKAIIKPRKRFVFFFNDFGKEKLFVVTSLRTFVVIRRKKTFFRRSGLVFILKEMSKSKVAGVSVTYGSRHSRLAIEFKEGEHWELEILGKEGGNESASEAYKFIKKFQLEVAKKDGDKKSELKKLQENAFIQYAGAMNKISESTETIAGAMDHGKKEGGEKDTDEKKS